MKRESLVELDIRQQRR